MAASDEKIVITAVNDVPATAPAVAPVQESCRIVYLTMVKNESKIILRSMEAAAAFVDAFVVCDTGSTDNTVDLAKDFIEKSNKPGGIVVHSWQNFGHNRTLSFMACRDFVKAVLGWDLARTYCLLLDGDMVFRWTPEFSRDCLTGAGYSLIQKSGALHYYNARLLRLSDDWKCIGATHEYWGGPGTKNLPVSTIWIDDLNDGGSKSDKFQRDARLLEAEREEQPNNPRTWFYLAQTYKDLGRIDDAIKAYERRIEIGGWREEVWYSHYMLSKLYATKNDLAMAEIWGSRAMAFHGARAEAVYNLCRLFRERGQHYKAWYYYTVGSKIPFPDDVLFLETSVYRGLFSYEASILHYYCFPQQRREGLKLSVDYLNGGLNENKENVWSNLPFYVESLPQKRIVPDFPFGALGLDKGVWRMSSGSMVKLDRSGCGRANILLNIRHVNYECSERGNYSSRDADGVVRTENAWITLEDKQCGTAFMRDELGLPQFETNILGMEDIRLWVDEAEGGEKQVRFTAAAKDRNAERRYRIIEGHYDWQNGALRDGRILTPPTNTDCEKNWTQIGKDKFVYGWYPLLICNGTGFALHGTVATELPWIFSKLRGSCGPISRTGSDGTKELIFLCHSVHHGSPRRYLHYLVVLDATTYEVKRWSLPFSFTGKSVEYCTGMVEGEDGHLLFVVSRFDKDPVAISAKLAKDFIFISQK